MANGLTAEIMLILTCRMKSNVLTASDEQVKVIEEFVNATSMLNVSALTVTCCDEDDYYDEDEFMFLVCKEVCEGRELLLGEVCSVANAHLAALRLVAGAELKLVERQCETLVINPSPIKTFMYK